MNFNIRGENIEVTPALRDYAEKKISKLEKYFHDELNATVYVNLKVYNDKRTKVEVTIPLSQLTLRAEEVNEDMYAGIDLIADKLERQIRKYKTRVNRKARELKEKDIFVNGAVTKEDKNTEDIEIVRAKRFDLKPMDSEEAVLQMNLLGHDFFVYTDAETNNTNIVYRRKDGRYGLIETV
ncbi:ribosome-associated translation inhibitor RaiA [Caldibacillus thermolactis]|jgi:putative sigma-54 modulation protein|uniref:Ribosome hibernation promoting factor n=1 Tax=Pallidibacillus thermolactis TaxID=251051 RepID=A0ABT2WC38_9BACI|nr:ribosome-associated translation inhibitor RaiA [Pallidibacillus thermolactis]MCU9593253.1 ribosome-associated translation inhibitor RaiA [Pallidibacillus thermolactis]MCU9599992.1 ribosome-associated translation inhibitor RaiA [Pallidibacillus thermolactis subsp. kokeshiiformis]MED1672953.1 ribosome-associated translation inhibitor RaiA [Pallidibacillus thermolactis subsp. kokeshiiformis]